MDRQPLELPDLELITALQPPDWPNIIPSIEFYIISTFCFPIKLIIDNKIVGIGTTIIHNDIAWLAHIIVHPEHRNQGIGKIITQTLVDSLQTKCDTIYLIATDLGIHGISAQSLWAWNFPPDTLFCVCGLGAG